MAYTLLRDRKTRNAVIVRKHTYIHAHEYIVYIYYAPI
jgi:hypothetical protein